MPFQPNDFIFCFIRMKRYNHRILHANDAMLPLSFEFFPPKTAEQRETLEHTAQRLKPLAPDYVSCTFGAGGSTLSYTYDTVVALKQHGLDVAPHLSCMGGTREEVRELLERYVALGCRRIVALRGDLPSGMATMGEFRHAIDLVRFIRSEFHGHFHIEVAGYPEFHPQARSADEDLRHLAEKVHAGANGVITQYFFNADAYCALRRRRARALGVDRCRSSPGSCRSANFSQLQALLGQPAAPRSRAGSRGACVSYGDDAESHPRIRLRFRCAAMRAPDRRRCAGGCTSTR
jgi:methylenetetrahydrofolate reductase (NADPH)